MSAGSSLISRVTIRAGRAAIARRPSDRRQGAADDVHLADRGPARQQRDGDVLLVGEGQLVRGRRQQRGAAARDQSEHEIVGAQPAASGTGWNASTTSIRRDDAHGRAWP